MGNSYKGRRGNGNREEYMLRETNLQKVAFSTTHEFP
jgi:hypothetical protein